MQDNFRRYIDGLFAETTPTKKSVELKEEMIQNLHDKYNDLISDGKTEEAAYNIAIAGVGDISSLLAELEKDTEPYVPDIQEYEKARQRSALFTSIAVMMYILSILPIIILSLLDIYRADIVGVPVMFLMIAGATGLLIYNSMTKPKFYKSSNSMVEDFRKWQTDEKDRKALRRALSSALWAIILALYFIISFMTFAWYMTWIIFVIGFMIEALINVVFTLARGGGK
ncbi:MAG: permease prefix domain 1-containing protein [Oscillospiraceae bacterium]|jgi:hypothetical protein|nr:permease prefix domain 1-containing protein [Oscillospiraceae bacterium]